MPQLTLPLLAGFTSYLSSNVALYYSPAIRAQYAARNAGKTPAVQFNDVMFALHALVLSSVTVSQYLFPHAWGFTPSSGNRPSRAILGIISGSAAGVFLTYFMIVSRGGGADADPATSWCELDLVYAVGYVKLVVTFVKYVPQLLANFRNQSTKGWSIWQILLDMAGGVLSVSQLIIDSYLQGDWSGVTGNPVKLLLGNVSMFFDVLFMTQHYVLYRGRDSERERLLDEEEEGSRLD